MACSTLAGSWTLQLDSLSGKLEIAAKYSDEESRSRAQLSELEALEGFIANPVEERCSELFRSTAPRIFAYFRTRGCDKALAEDLTQEVMIAVFRRATTLRHRELFRPWVYRIARNALLQHVRRMGRQVETVQLDSAAGDAGASPPDPLLPAQFAEWMKFLEPDERRIMMLRFIEELDYHEIAEALGLPLGTVQWKIFHSKKKLAARFGPQPG
jgi:RNA polymerase sigma-70 factor (ECF subfamily)